MSDFSQRVLHVFIQIELIEYGDIIAQRKTKSYIIVKNRGKIKTKKANPKEDNIPRNVAPEIRT